MSKYRKETKAHPAIAKFELWPSATTLDSSSAPSEGSGRVSIPSTTAKGLEA